MLFVLYNQNLQGAEVTRQADRLSLGLQIGQGHPKIN